ncbi:hypothetical protein Ahia01_001197100, partial [Argonauta hians]
FAFSLHSFAALIARPLIAMTSFLPKRCQPEEIVVLYVSAAISSAVQLILPFIKDFSWLCCALVMSGLFVGLRNSVVPMLCLNILGQKHYAMALGFTQTFVGLSSIMMGSLGGYIRDVTKSYNTTFIAFSSFTFVSTIVLAAVYIFLFSQWFRDLHCCRHHTHPKDFKLVPQKIITADVEG